MNRFLTESPKIQKPLQPGADYSTTTILKSNSTNSEETPDQTDFHSRNELLITVWRLLHGSANHTSGLGLETLSDFLDANVPQLEATDHLRGFGNFRFR